ncbi:unnamed protein product, partial [Prorocentrum cordatum]
MPVADLAGWARARALAGASPAPAACGRGPERSRHCGVPPAAAAGASCGGPGARRWPPPGCAPLLAGLALLVSPAAALARRLRRLLCPLTEADRRANDLFRRDAPLDGAVGGAAATDWQLAGEGLRRLRAVVAAMDQKGCEGPLSAWETERAAAPRPGGGEVPVLIRRCPGGGAEVASRAGCPLVVWLHGGAFTISSVKSGMSFYSATEPFGAHVAGELRAACGPFVWASIEYRRAPEAPFPAAIEDCVAALRWLQRPEQAERFGYSPARISLAGASAGANLAAFAALLSDAPLSSLVLLFPFLDPATSRGSYARWGHLGYSYAPFLRWSWRAYLQGRSPDAANPALQPGWSGGARPPVLVCTGTADALREEGLDMVRRLRRQGVRCRHVRARGSHCAGILFDGWARRAVVQWWLKRLRESGE